MENQNEQTNTESKAPALGGDRRSTLAQAVLGAIGRKPAEEEIKIPEASTGAQPENTEIDLLAGTNNSSTLEGGTGGGEVELEEVDVWQFGGIDYTADQVEAALREHDTYQRYNQSVEPLATAIQQSEAAISRFKEMALTETEQIIANLEHQIQSGQLDPRQKSVAYDRLGEANKRLKYLSEEADKSARVQREAKEKIQKQRASQTVSELTRQKWTAQEIKAVGASLEKIVGDKIGDVISPELMQVFRDAAELRHLRDTNAKRLGKKVNETTNGLKATKQPLAKQEPKAPAAKTFGQKVWGDKYK